MKIKASAKIDTQDVHHNTVYGSKKSEKPKCTRVKDQLKKKQVPGYSLELRQIKLQASFR